MSNAFTDGAFSFQTRSAAVEPAGEQEPNKVFIGQFSFKAVSPNYTPGLALSVGPDTAEGSRMSYVQLLDAPEGVNVYVSGVPTGHTVPSIRKINDKDVGWHIVIFDRRLIATLDRGRPARPRRASRDPAHARHRRALS